AESGLKELDAGRDAVAAAAGDDAALRAALAALDETFTDVTGRAPTHADGQMYAGRTVCYEDTVRDLHATLPPAVLDALAGPLALLCTAARWLSTRVADAYLTELRALHEELAAEHPGRDVSFAELNFLAQGLLFGGGERPVDAVTEEFTARWAAL